MADTTPTSVTTTRTRGIAFAVAASLAFLTSARAASAGVPGTPTRTPTPSFTASSGPSPTITPTPSIPPSPIDTPTPTFTPVVHTSPTQTPTPVPTVSPNVTDTTSSVTPTPSPTTSPGTPCGNFQLDPGETCDPPGAPQPPNGNPCRPDCTYCGDGVTQASGGETCDDGNSVSGCRPDRPQQALDACLNNCEFPICEDPSRIQLYPDRNDVVQVHGRLIAPTAIEFEDGEFRVRIARRVCTHDTSMTCSDDAQCDALSTGSVCTSDDPAAVVFEQSVAGSAIDGSGKRWKYRNPAAKTDGGIYQLKIIAKTKKKVCGGGPNAGGRCTSVADCPQGNCLAYYVLKLKAYGTANNAVPDMQTRIYGGGYGWAVRGIWQQFPKGWRLYKKSPLLDPWL
jgi:hypothetical protein